MNCDGLARWYRWLEYLGLGRKLERCRGAFLPEIADARRVLVLGDGDGRFLAAFLRANAVAEVDAVDSSARMLTLARQRTADHAARVRFHHAEVSGWQPPGADYDLIVTHFFLDCFTTEQLTPLAAGWKAVATEDARWVVSDFHQPAHGFAAWRARLWIGGLYAFFRLATGLRVRRLPDHRAVLETQGFRCEQTILADREMLTAELWRRT